MGDLRDIDRKLKEHGVVSSGTIEQKLQHVWSLYLESEVNLKGALDNMGILRLKQADEMKEVENYVEHIRSLSEERETLTAEFEEENDQLKAEVQLLKADLAGGGTHDDIKEMLSQQGLEQIASSTVTEQIAYLLVERAKLMDDLENEQNRNTHSSNESSLDTNEIKKLLQQERVDFEEEITQQRESTRLVKEQMQATHNQELAVISGDNERLSRELSRSLNMVKDLETALEELQNDQDRQKSEYDVVISDLQQQLQDSQQQDLSSSSDTIEKLKSEKSKLNVEVMTLKGKLKVIEQEKKCLSDTVRTLTFDFQKLKDTNKGLQEQFDTSFVKHNGETDDLKIKLHSLEAKNQENLEGRRSLEMKLEFAEKDIAELKAREIEYNSKNKKQNKFEQDLESHYKQELSELRSQHQSSQVDLISLRETLDRETSNKTLLESKLHAIESDFRIEKQKFNSLETEYKDKIQQLDVIQSKNADDYNNAKSTWSALEEDYKQQLEEVRSECKTIAAALTNERLAKKHNEDHTNQITTYTDEIKELKGSVDSLEKALKSANDSLQELCNDKTDTEKELEKVIGENRVLAKEFSENSTQLDEYADRIEMLEKVSGQLEADNTELASKLSETLEQLAKTEDEMHKESQKLLAAQTNTLETKLQGATEDLQIAEKEISRLKEQLLSSTSKSSLLQEEIHTVKELSRLKEVSQSQQADSRLQVQLQNEIQTKKEYEEKNILLEQELSKVWAQMKDLLEKISRLETDNNQLQSDIARNSGVSPDRTSSFNAIQRRADLAEKRVSELQFELEDAMSRLTTAEAQLRDGALLRLDLQAKVDESLRLKNKLNEERLNKSLEIQTSDELKLQLESSRKKEAELQEKMHKLQHDILDKDSEIATVKEDTKQIKDKHQVAENNKHSLVQKMHDFQQETETLQIELLAMTEKYELQLKRYEMRKEKHKSQLQKARELFNKEKSKLNAKIVSLEQELYTTKGSFNKEHEWKEKMEDDYRILITEKRDLLAKHAEVEEAYRDRQRQFMLLQNRSHYLEEENQKLMSKFDTLHKQKLNIEKNLKELRFEKQKEALQNALKPTFNSHSHMSNALGPGLTSTWDPNVTDSVLTTVHIENPHLTMSTMNGFRSKSLGGSSLESVDS
ncbi:unnamed protein product [Owenia fusiformis]|uniref:Uncharacterized protein n=1 Tax=Owenia fusiformis TaxID=6347 RepID=A0A8S4MZE5_OWEFU|nr:unnamed protein product [Owenia fusiformis]